MMSDKLREAALMAVDALDSDDPTIQTRAALNLRAALAEPAQEPMHPEIKKMYEDYFDKCFRESSAQQRPWVGLTGTEINHIFARNVGYPESMMKEVETLLKDKNT
jgi:hypothetical protein